MLNNSGDWTDEKNDRRCELIDKEIEGVIEPFEKLELATLQQQMSAYRQKNAPLPLKEAQATVSSGETVKIDNIN